MKLRMSRGRRRGRNRRRRSGRGAPRLRRLVAGLLGAVLAYVLAVNALVRVAGDGYPHPLSPRFMPEKTAALGQLALHWGGHVLSDHDAPPELLLRRAARRHGIRSDLLLAIAEVESDLRAHRISHAGAMGMMQLMPETAAQYGVSDPFDPAQAADGAAAFLAGLSRRYRGDVRRVAAAYNAGPGRVPQRGPMQLPAETRGYVRRVLARMQASPQLAAARETR